MSKIQFIYFEGCPKAAGQWANLLEATAKITELNLDIEKIDTADNGSDASFKQWGSPAILLDGKDITNYQPQDSDCCSNHCRYYQDEPDGILSAETIEKLVLAKI